MLLTPSMIILYIALGALLSVSIYRLRKSWILFEKRSQICIYYNEYRVRLGVKILDIIEDVDFVFAHPENFKGDWISQLLDNDDIDIWLRNFAITAGIGGEYLNVIYSNDQRFGNVVLSIEVFEIK
jgi:hypothetical protein